MTGKELHNHLSRVARDLESNVITPQKAIAHAKVCAILISNIQLHLSVCRLNGASPAKDLLLNYSANP